MISQIPYSPRSWYWVVGNQPNVVFSGASGTYVADSDGTYQQWLTAGGVATTVNTDGELADVLANYCSGMMNPTAVRAAGWTDWGAVPVGNQFSTLVYAGVTVQSTGTPALDGVYAMDADTRVRQNSNVNYIQMNNAFAPNNSPTKDWPDVTGALHTFPNTKAFQDFVTGTGNWYSALADWNAAGGVGTLPTEPVTIP